MKAMNIPLHFDNVQAGDILLDGVTVVLGFVRHQVCWSQSRTSSNGSLLPYYLCHQCPIS